MRTYLGAGIACLTLMLTGIARADHLQGFDGVCDPRNKTYNVSYQIDCDDLKDHGNQGNGNNGNFDNGNKGDNGGGICLPPPCVDNNDGCDHSHDGCDHHKPTCPTDPHDPAVVPLPASSALGGVGLAALALIGWLRSKRVTLA
jgi:hypothetical protein